MAKMSISEKHRKFGHIAHTAVKHTISNGPITGIEIDDASIPDSCAKAKSNTQPFPKESTTRAKEYSERVHWDLWGPTTVQTIDGFSYCAARIDGATREMKLFFLKKKSDTEAAYKKDKAYQDSRGTTRELAIHGLRSQNGVLERGMHTRAE